ncbi:MAG: NAD-binding protein [Phascolarctobacterium faecium]
MAVVGGGNTALDDALVLSFTSKKVYLIHRSDTFSGENGCWKSCRSMITLFSFLTVK